MPGSWHPVWMSAVPDMLRIGTLELATPVVLAPMAGVTDAPYRVLCASFGGGLFVSEMVSARALVEGHAASWRMTGFHPDERVRSLQLYGTDPRYVAEAVRRLVGEGRVDHLDLNFGCPAPKVTRNGGGAALPFKRRLLAEVVRAAVGAASAESGGAVPVTVKLRLGIDDEHLTYLDAGRTAEQEGAAAMALHARTALDHYGPPARWEHIAELKDALTVPVLGNGDVMVAGDAERMMATTGCDGIVVGRGCLGRPWLFADLEAALGGGVAGAAPNLGEVVEVVRRHVSLALDWRRSTGSTPERVVAGLRKHLNWYLKGYPVGRAARLAAGQVRDPADLDALLSRLDPSLVPHDEAARFNRSHSGSLRRVALPEGWLDDPDHMPAPLRDPVAAISGG